MISITGSKTRSSPEYYTFRGRAIRKVIEMLFSVVAGVISIVSTAARRDFRPVWGKILCYGTIPLYRGLTHSLSIYVRMRFFSILIFFLFQRQRQTTKANQLTFISEDYFTMFPLGRTFKYTGTSEPHQSPRHEGQMHRRRPVLGLHHSRSHILTTAHFRMLVAILTPNPPFPSPPTNNQGYS